MQLRRSIVLYILISTLSGLSMGTFNMPFADNTYAQSSVDSGPYVGVNMRGFYTALSQQKNDTLESSLPPDYYEKSFRILSQAGMNHVRYTFYWEGYVLNPTLYMKELMTVANTADKYGINVLYDNHQFHTSSYLNPQRGNGFPSTFFENNPTFSYASGGGTKYQSAKLWWTDWWNRSIKDANGADGWIVMADFLKKIVNALDSHPSTLGYEILSEPQVHDRDQWEKIGRFNTFMVNELRQLTDKTLAYSMNIPVDLKSPIAVDADNLAKMAPENKANVVFKISLYGLPTPDTYQGDRLVIFTKASEIAGVPLYIGEWNNVRREQTINEEGEVVTEIVPEKSDINQTEANLIVQTFKDIDAWGMAYWQWRIGSHQVANYNLISLADDGSIQTTKYFDILKNAYLNAYGNLSATKPQAAA